MRRLLGIIAFLAAAAGHAELAVVAGKGSSIERLDGQEVANIFLARTTQLRDGTRVHPVELNNNAFKAAFYREISGKTLAQVNSYWTTLVFTGKGKPPRSVEDPSQVVELLNSDPHAVAYLPVGKATESLKILHTFN